MGDESLTSIESEVLQLKKTKLKLGILQQINFISNIAIERGEFIFELRDIIKRLIDGEHGKTNG